jgi:hypothetical protein
MGKICSQCGYELNYLYRCDAHAPINYRVKQWFCNHCNYYAEEKVSMLG